jgi:hypothetical protein
MTREGREKILSHFGIRYKAASDIRRIRVNRVISNAPVAMAASLQMNGHIQR